MPAAGCARRRSGHRLAAADYVFVSQGPRWTFVRNHSEVHLVLTNNRIEGDAQPVAGPGQVD